MNRVSARDHAGHLVLRRAHADDMDGIRALGREFCWNQGTMTEPQEDYVEGVFERLWGESHLRRLITEEAAAFVVAADNTGEIAALALAVPKLGDPSVACLSRLCVPSACRAGTLGQRLLSACLERLPATVRAVDTFVPQSDEALLSFYERHGFQRRSVRQLGPGTLACIFVEMTRPLVRGRTGLRRGSGQS